MTNRGYRAARRRHLTRLLLCDGLAAMLAFAAAYGLRARLPEVYLPLEFYAPVAGGFALLLIAVFARNRLYTAVPEGPAAAEAFRVAWAVSVAVGIVLIAVFWIRELSLSRLLVGLTWVLLIVFVVAGRLLARAVRAGERRGGFGIKQVLLVGGAAEEPKLRGLYTHDAQLETAQLDLSSESVLAGVIESERYDEIVIHGAEAAEAAIFRWGGLAAKHAVALKILPPGATLAAIPLEADPTSPVPLLVVGQGLLEPANQLGKRTLDLVLGVLLLPPVVLLMLPLGLIVWLSAPGASPLFWHERLGRGGRRIRICKFRTMVPNAQALLERDDSLRQQFEDNYKLPNDPRQTALGRLLRRTSLDELPQLLNILAGDMSFVGPRPIVPPELAKYGPYSDLLLAVAPGLTGMWQVSGRSEVSYDERIQLDMLYIERWSLLLDLQILWMTIPAVLSRRGAG